MALIDTNTRTSLNINSYFINIYKCTYFQTPKHDLQTKGKGVFVNVVFVQERKSFIKNNIIIVILSYDIVPFPYKHA